jgi:uncharacterized RDD family membrane protein YckC
MEDAENDVVYAGFWLRLCANLIDTIIFVPLIFLFLFIIYGADALLYKEIEVLYLGAWHFILEVIVPFILVIWLWLRFSATPGKMLLRLKVVDIKTSEPISFRQAIIRYFGYVPSILCFFIGIVWVAFDIHKQGWHDKLASTAVIRVNK